MVLGINVINELLGKDVNEEARMSCQAACMASVKHDKLRSTRRSRRNP